MRIPRRTCSWQAARTMVTTHIRSGNFATRCRAANAYIYVTTRLGPQHRWLLRTRSCWTRSSRAGRSPRWRRSMRACRSL